MPVVYGFSRWGQGPNHGELESVVPFDPVNPERPSTAAD